jgi:ESCRT-II complex subunit VPS22
MMRKAGVAAIKKKEGSAAAFSAMGKTLEQQKMSSVLTTLNQFKDSLVLFAQKHRDKINSDPEFRMQFHQMCKGLGVDPLASSKGFWSDILGVGDFYFELGVIIIQICVKTRASNGGLLRLTELMELLQAHAKMQRKQKISPLDVMRSVEKLAVLGGGFRIIKISGEDFVASTPLEINTDHQVLIAVAQADGSFSQSLLATKHGWTAERFDIVLTPLLYEGIVWVDSQAGREHSYAVPSLSLATDDSPPPYEH